MIYEGLDLAIRKGEIITILGGSGSGKSVMLKMMLGIIPWDAGRVTVLGTDITGLSDREILPVRRRLPQIQVRLAARQPAAR